MAGRRAQRLPRGQVPLAEAMQHSVLRCMTAPQRDPVHGLPPLPSRKRSAAAAQLDGPAQVPRLDTHVQVSAQAWRSPARCSAAALR